MHHFAYRDGVPARRGRRSPRLGRRRRHAVLLLFHRDARAALPGLRRRLRRHGRARLLRHEGELEPGGAAHARPARRRHGHRVGGRAAARPGGGRAGRAHRLLGRRQDPGRDGGWRSTAASSASTSKASRSSRRCPRSRPPRAARPGLDPGQPGRGRQDAHEDLDRQVREQVRHPDRARPRCLCARRRRLPGIEVAGVDMHIGSQITDLEPFDNATAAPGRARPRPDGRDGHALHHIDLGGGLGIPYRADDRAPARPGRPTRPSSSATRSGLGLKLIFEIGRMIAGNAGILVTRVRLREGRRGQDLRDRRRRP